MIEIVKVGMADLNVAASPKRLRTTGLGSCVGIVLFDKIHRIGGLAHIMLPSSEMVKIGEINKAKYADTAIPLMVDMMVSLGANKNRLVAKLAGGAQMFQFQTQNEMMRIGPRNVTSSKEALVKLNIPIIAEDVGENYGRTIELDTETGILSIKTANKGINEL